MIPTQNYRLQLIVVVMDPANFIPWIRQHPNHYGGVIAQLAMFVPTNKTAKRHLRSINKATA